MTPGTHPPLRSADARLHVLYVDDFDAMAELTCELLAQAGVRASSASSGRRALEMLACTPGGFDVVVADFDMPGLSGAAFARELASRRPHLPVIFVTVQPGTARQAQAQALEAGAPLVLLKDLDCAKLASAIRRIAGGRAG